MTDRLGSDIGHGLLHGVDVFEWSIDETYVNKIGAGCRACRDPGANLAGGFDSPSRPRKLGRGVSTAHELRSFLARHCVLALVGVEC